MSEKRVSKWGKLFATVILLPAAIIVPVLSLESHYAPATQAQTQPSSSEQQQRINKYKAGLGEEVSTSEQARIRLRCDVAQANAKTLSDKLASVRSNRNGAYDTILNSLGNLQQKLQDQAFETSELDENIETLTEKVNSFKANMGDYYQAVNDLATLDCKNDPVAFIATLKAARNVHEKVQPQPSDIRSYVTNTVKPTLQNIRQQLEGGQTTGGGQ